MALAKVLRALPDGGRCVFVEIEFRGFAIAFGELRRGREHLVEADGEWLEACRRRKELSRSLGHTWNNAIEDVIDGKQAALAQ